MKLKAPVFRKNNDGNNPDSHKLLFIGVSDIVIHHSCHHSIFAIKKKSDLKMGNKYRT